ncbi:High-affnity carbon uptake protein Hat/HatR [Rhodocytophaga rosea]|uniref:High-affnity carbon uptake protein Hat/HatR n=1 Tax=Rhodocytophaga rosea TaxID=2704465 RepID=A0A6C0GDM7_9BACT|nr:High-affnity carbon uptake protein Hat/HatR [Rhodocytophaga rosea]QHT66038.1 High-affnity carbon uptake protein Hat/HatR [Rhodocytophaga rosea]
MLTSTFAESQIRSTQKLNPFPGLRPFKYEESHLFFGREGQVDQVLDKLIHNRFVAVLGTSGIGKSSFLNCGLLPILYGDYATESSAQWEVCTFRPGASPIRNMAEALTETILANETDEEKKMVIRNMEYSLLCESSLGLVESVRSKFAREPKNYLMYIDQFEELFRFKNIDSTSVEEAAAFVKLLVTAVRQSEVPVYVIITLRSDFVGDCSQYPQLTKLINDSQFLIPQMTRKEKRRAITGPISVMGGEINERLVQQLLNDVGDNPDQLPIMQHALMRTWDYWQRNALAGEPMNLPHYEAIGGMGRALSIHANETYNELTDPQKKICERVFKTITEKGDEGRGIRRPTKLQEIATIAQSPIAEVAEVIDRFRSPGRTLLMPPHTVPLDGESIIDISHESLMRIWITLNKWVDEEAESSKLYLRLAEAAERHQQGKAGLWRPPDLQIALHWAEEHQPSLTWGLRYHPAYERTMLFLDFSKKEYEKEQIIREKQQRRKLVFSRILAIIFGIIGIIVGILFIFAYFNQQEAEDQRKIADEKARAATIAEAKANQSAQIAEKEREVAKVQEKLARNAESKAVLEREAADKAKKEAEISAKEAERQAVIASEKTVLAEIEKENAKNSEQKAIEASNRAYNLRLLSIARSMAIKSVQLSDTTQKGLVAQQAYLFNKNNGGELNDPDIYDGMYYAVKALHDESYNQLKVHSANVRALVATTSGNTMYSAASDGMIYRLNVNDPSGNKMLMNGADAAKGYIHKALALSPDGRWLASGGDYGHIQLYDLTKPAGDLSIQLKGNIHEIWYLAFTPDSKGLISSDSDKRLIYWDIESKNPVEIAKSDLKINSLSLHPRTNQVAIAKENGLVVLLDRDKSNAEQIIYQDPQGIDMISVAFSPDGKWLAAGNEKGVVRLFEVKVDDFNLVPQSLTGHKARVNTIRFSKDSKRLATGSFDKTVRIWSMNNTDDPPIILRDHADWVWSIEFSPDGEKLLAGCRDYKIRIWPTNVSSMADIICKKLNRSMTTPEWERFVAPVKEVPYETTCR